VTPLTISDTVSIMCSTDLDVTTIEWIRDGITVANSASKSLSLLLDPVSADHHNTQYTCRVISPYGIQEETINITVLSKSFVRFRVNSSQINEQLTHGKDNWAKTKAHSIANKVYLRGPSSYPCAYV